ncbi:unnamed protein product [Caenorhabditis angaria]|uniref:Uncharacterized protein n=1 Tax=Caenorhabditis angaria TaxID=860376 RepID=A0A9P1N9U8_9PELO|nr:unnamed protein product [Caenorhabditis angaria]
MTNKYQAVANAKTTKERISAFKSIFQGSVWNYLSYSLLFILPVIFISVGIWKLDECSLAPKFPIWLIVSGVLVFIMKFVFLIAEKKKALVNSEFPLTENESEEERTNIKLQRKNHYPSGLILIGLGCRLAHLFWFFVGVYFVIRSFGATGTCHWAPYYLTTITIIFPIIILILLCPCCCVVCCAYSLIKSDEAAEGGEGKEEQEATSNA